MARTGISKTLGPIHFEDLDPRRFEDLVRELAYDFKNWQSIEATGRGGSDEGFDIRAYEQLESGSIIGDEENANEEMPHPMEGHVWMFQCKREKKIGPTRVASIISEGVNPKNPPYGYVLAAPANFSKASYDKFREELRKRGVMEFYLWGRATLEDMLHLPKNDHILFTFFGLSLVSRRKARATEIRAVVSTKNKLLKLLGPSPHHEAVLLRDTKDVHYPYKEEYKDFEKHPRWKEYPVVEMHPLGLRAQIRNYFAFCDLIKKEWDYSDALNLVVRRQDHYDPKEREKNYDLQRNIEDFWGFFQKSNQAKFIVDGLIRFDSIVAVDSEGDSLHKFPHIYVDFQGDQGPFAGFFNYLELENHHDESLDGLKRVKKFPKIFSKPRFGTIYRDRTISLNERTRTLLKHGIYIIYDCDNRYQFLNPSDVIGVEQTEKSDGKLDMIKITNKRQELARDFLEQRKDDPIAIRSVEEQIGRSLDQDDTITIYEFIVVPEWQLKEK